MTDIEDLLAAAADDTDQPLRHSVDEIVVRGRRSLRNRRLAAAVTATLTSAAIVAGVTVWQNDRSNGVQPVTIGPTQPAPPVSPLADGEIIKRCGQIDKEWRSASIVADDGAGPLDGQWSVPLKTGQGSHFLAFLLSPDRSVVATCEMGGKTLSTRRAYSRRPTADLPAQPLPVPTGHSPWAAQEWLRVAPEVTRLVALPDKGEPRDALVSNGYAVWGLRDGAKPALEATILGLDAKGAVVFRVRSLIPAG